MAPPAASLQLGRPLVLKSSLVLCLVLAVALQQPRPCNAQQQQQGSPQPVPAGSNASTSAAPTASSQQQAQQQQAQQQQQQQQQQASGGTPPPAAVVSAVAPDPDAAKSPGEVNDVLAADDSAATPAVSATQGGGANGSSLNTSINLVTQPGCSSGNISGFLPAGLDGSCAMQGVVGRREVDLYSFALPPTSNATRPFRVLLILRSVDGAPTLGISVPDGNGTVDTIPEGRGISIYATESSNEQFIDMPWAFVRRNPGNYIISIARTTRRALYTLQVLTPYDDVRLAAADREFMSELYQSCCLATGSNSPFCGQYLPQGLAADERLPENDICHLSPITCNSEGQLTRLSVARAGLECPGGLPKNLTKLSALVSLDLAFNALNNTLEEVAEIVGALPTLQNVFIRYTGLRGSISCDLVKGPAITRLSFSGNRITGSVPDCLLQSPTLEELYFSQTFLTGSLPDVVPPGSKLRTIFNNNWPKRMKRPALTGPLPASLLSSQSLVYLSLGNHNLSGGVDRWPPGLKWLNLSSNNLDGSLSAGLPPSLDVLDLSHNQLNGSLPADLSGLTQMTQLDVQQNKFTGPFPSGLPPNAVVIDVSNNLLSGNLPSPLPATLRFLDASFNNLTGSLPALPTNSKLRYLLLADNRLSGQLPASLLGGAASDLQFLDLSDNQLTGQLDGSSSPAADSSNAATGRRLLATKLDSPTAYSVGGAASAIEQHLAGYRDGDRAQRYLGQQRRVLLQAAATPAATPAAAAGLDVGGAWSNLSRLGYIDLSDNGFSGPVPAVLGVLPGLVYLDLSRNDLSGSLKPFADALAATADGSNSTLVYLSVADNRLSGNVPAGLSSSAILDPNVNVQLEPNAAAPRVLDLSGNDFSGPFPSWLITQPPLVLESCGSCEVAISVNGSSMRLSCPEGLEVTAQQLPFLQQAGYQCWNAAGQQVSLLTTATSLPTAAAATPSGGRNSSSLSDLSSRFYQPDGSDRSIYAASHGSQGGSSGDGNNLSAGAIAGIVIGSVVGAALLAAASVFAAKAVRKRRQGWRKDDLNGGVGGPGDDLNGPFGASGALPPHLAAPMGTAGGVDSVGLPNGAAASRSIASSITTPVPSSLAGSVGSGAVGSFKPSSSLKKVLGGTAAGGSGGSLKLSGSNNVVLEPPPHSTISSRQLSEQTAGLEMMNNRMHDDIV